MEAASISHTDITIVGTGIHGTHMLRRIAADPILSKRRIATIDPSTTGCAIWNQRTENCGMRYLRSPASHGISPQLTAIRRLAGEQCIDAPFTAPYHRPSLELFRRHIEHESRRLPADTTHHEGVLTSVVRNGRFLRLSVSAADGTEHEIVSRDVVLAIGTPPPHIPQPFLGVEPIKHVYDPTFNRRAIPNGAKVAIVGGGIAAAHLALDLIERLGHVTILNRDPFYPAQFDSDPCFIGPKCGDSFREISDYGGRRRTLQDCRRPGSIPPDLFARIESMRENGLLTIVPTEIRAARVAIDGGDRFVGIEVTGTGAVPFYRRYDEVVLATGFAPGPPQVDLVSLIAAKNSLPLHDDGFPIVTEYLGWEGPRQNPHNGKIFCSGALAELELGPPARNIIGAHLAGRRIVPRLHREDAP